MSATTVAVTVYILAWPVIVALVLAVILISFIREVRTARRKGKGIV